MNWAPLAFCQSRMACPEGGRVRWKAAQGEGPMIPFTRSPMAVRREDRRAQAAA